MKPDRDLSGSAVVFHVRDQDANEAFLFPGGELVPQWIELRQRLLHLGRVGHRRAGLPVFLDTLQDF